MLLETTDHLHIDNITQEEKNISHEMFIHLQPFHFSEFQVNIRFVIELIYNSTLLHGDRS